MGTWKSRTKPRLNQCLDWTKELDGEKNGIGENGSYKVSNLRDSHVNFCFFVNQWVHSCCITSLQACASPLWSTCEASIAACWNLLWLSLLLIVAPIVRPTSFFLFRSIKILGLIMVKIFSGKREKRKEIFWGKPRWDYRKNQKTYNILSLRIRSLCWSGSET